MPSSRQLISSQVLGSSVASVTFSAIPATYTDLVLRFSARTDATGAANVEVLAVAFNETYGTNFSGIRVYGNGTSALSTLQTGQFNYVVGVNDTATASTFSSAEMYIPSYLSNTNKPFLGFSVGENNATATQTVASAGLWSNTSAITSLSIKPNSGGNFLSGSSFYLYGLKSS